MFILDFQTCRLDRQYDYTSMPDRVGHDINIQILRILNG